MLLPPEITEHVLGYLDAATLDQVIPEVCRKWEIMAERILEKRIIKMTTYFSTNLEHLEEIKTQLCPAQQNCNRKILEIYERAFLNKDFEIKSTDLSDRQVANFVVEVQSAKGCDCGRPSSCFVHSLHWMPCHRLILIQLPEKIDFYDMSVLTSGENGGGCSPIKFDTVLVGYTTVDNVRIDNNTHSAISVFHDKVLCQETTRALILFRVKEVSRQPKRTVVLENIQRIFLPFWSCDLLLLENKVCVLFTTGRVLIWRMEEDGMEVSTNTCADVATIRKMRCSKMYACKNLVIIKIVADDTAYWSIFDSDEDGTELELQTLDLNTYIKNSFLDKGISCKWIFDLFVTVNAFIVHCKVITDQPHESKKVTSYPAVFCRRIQRTPTLLDFQSPEKFDFIFYNEHGAEELMIPADCLTSPIMSAFLKEPSGDTHSFLGIRDSKIKSWARPSSSRRGADSKLQSLEYDCTLFSLSNSI